MLEVTAPVPGGASVVAQLLMTWAYRWVTNLQAGILSQLTVVLTLILVPALSWIGYFAYAKTTGQPNVCLFTALCQKFK